MSIRLVPIEQHGLLAPESPTGSYDLEEAEYQAQDPRFSSAPSARRGSARLLPKSLRALSPLRIKRLFTVPRTRRRRAFYLFGLLLRWTFGLVFALIVFTGIFRPSYTNRPPHYKALDARIKASQDIGRANPLNEKIFISISLYDKEGHLAGGKWGQLLIELIGLLGHDNVFLSIYENDSGQAAADALEILKTRVPCQHEIVAELNTSREHLPRIMLQDGSTRLKRITYLSDMRNRALRPLDDPTGTIYDKVLIMNDIFFHPADVAQLLFSTNIGENGKTDYLAACSVDFEQIFKFYDPYATRDLDGYSMGDIFYPWFSGAGRGLSRQDVLNQKDAVRVRSCWGGMVAFDAKYLQASEQAVDHGLQNLSLHTISPANPEPVSLPVRFRAEPEVYFDACECCLILADVQQVAQRQNRNDDSGVYMNPYIRVAYKYQHLWWQDFVRRFERLYSIVQSISTVLKELPTYNPIRTIEEGQEYEDEIWIHDSDLAGNGSWQLTNRIGRSGMFCGVREMQVLLDEPREQDKNWMNTPIPPGGRLY